MRRLVWRARVLSERTSSTQPVPTKAWRRHERLKIGFET
jgi:hypothetical protein